MNKKKWKQKGTTISPVHNRWGHLIDIKLGKVYVKNDGNKEKIVYTKLSELIKEPFSIEQIFDVFKTSADFMDRL